MSQAQTSILPVRVDPRYFADQSREIEGYLSSNKMARLKERSISLQPEVYATLRFTPGIYGLPQISGEIKFELGLQCERCLDEVQIYLDPKIMVIAKSEKDNVPENSNELEFYEYSGNFLELSNFVEDELLLNLPLAPKHKDISLCNQDMLAWLASSDESPIKKRSPFAILKR